MRVLQFALPSAEIGLLPGQRREAHLHHLPQSSRYPPGRRRGGALFAGLPRLSRSRAFQAPSRRGGAHLLPPAPTPPPPAPPEGTGTAPYPRQPPAANAAAPPIEHVEQNDGNTPPYRGP